MFGPWFQLYVQAPEGNGYTSPEAMMRVDQHMQQIGACMNVPRRDGLPEPGEDGTYEVRVPFGSPDLARYVLTKQYGLTIVREVRNDD